MTENIEVNRKKSAFVAVAAALREYDGEAISLLVGEPWYGPPVELVGALQTAANADSGYSPRAGLETFREVLAGIERERGVDTRPENIVVGNGSKELLFGLITLLSGKGLSTPAPYYPGVAAQAEVLGLGLKVLPTEGGSARLSTEAIGRKRGGCLVVSSPSNPTGEVYSEEERRELVGRCRENECVLIADEAYIDLVHDGSNCTFGTADPELETSVLLRSFSKSLGICGWRMGYAVAAPVVSARLAEWQGGVLNPPSVLVQRCLERYLGENRIDGTTHQKHYREVLTQVRSDLASLGIEAVNPDGGFYLFCDLRKHLHPERGLGSVQFCVGLARNEGIGIWPGEDFGVPDWARISCGRIDPGQADSMSAELKPRLGNYLESMPNFR